MKTKTNPLMTICMMLVAVAMTPASYADDPRETLNFYVDCFASPGFMGTDNAVDHADTSDTLTVEFYQDGAKFHSTDGGDDNHCDWETDKLFGSGSFSVDEVRISTSGDDALFMDQVYLGVPTLVQGEDHVNTWGSDNTKGWCLSTNWNDADGAWADNVPSGHCRSCYRFVTSDLGAGKSCPGVDDDED